MRLVEGVQASTQVCGFICVAVSGQIEANVLAIFCGIKFFFLFFFGLYSCPFILTFR
jgi:hypothetical protein